jgi:hypothetical protein
MLLEIRRIRKISLVWIDRVFAEALQVGCCHANCKHAGILQPLAKPAEGRSWKNTI